MNILPLDQMLILLNEIKASMHDETNTGAVEKLDEAIAFIEHSINNDCNDQETTNKVIILVGKFLDKLPSIIRLIDFFSD